MMKRFLLLMGFGGLLAAATLFATPAHADANSFITALKNDTVVDFYGPDTRMLTLGYLVCSDTMNGFSQTAIVRAVYLNPYYDFQTPSAANEFVTLAENNLC